MASCAHACPCRFIVAVVAGLPKGRQVGAHAATVSVSYFRCNAIGIGNGIGEKWRRAGYCADQFVSLQGVKEVWTRHIFGIKSRWHNNLT